MPRIKGRIISSLVPRFATNGPLSLSHPNQPQGNFPVGVWHTNLVAVFEGE